MDSPASPTRPHISMDVEFGSRPRITRTYSRTSTCASSTITAKDSLLNSPSRKLSKFLATIGWKPSNENSSPAKQDSGLKTLSRTVIDSFSSIRSRRWSGKGENQGEGTTRSRTISPLKYHTGNLSGVSYYPKRRKSVGDLFAGIRGTIGRTTHPKRGSIFPQSPGCENSFKRTGSPNMQLVAEKSGSASMDNPKAIKVNSSPQNTLNAEFMKIQVYEPPFVEKLEEDIRPKTPDSYLKSLIEIHGGCTEAKELPNSLSSIVEYANSCVHHGYCGPNDRFDKSNDALTVNCQDFPATYDLDEPESPLSEGVLEGKQPKNTQEQVLLHAVSQDLSPTIEGIDPFFEDEWHSLFAAPKSPPQKPQIIYCRNPLVLNPNRNPEDVLEDEGKCVSETCSPSYTSDKGKREEAEITKLVPECLGRPVLSLKDLDPKFLQRLKERNERYAILNIGREDSQNAQASFGDGIAQRIKLTVAKMTEKIHSTKLETRSMSAILDTCVENSPEMDIHYDDNISRFLDQESKGLCHPLVSDSDQEDLESFEYFFPTDLSEVLDSITRGYAIFQEAKSYRSLKDFPSQENLYRGSLSEDQILEQSSCLRDLDSFAAESGQLIQASSSVLYQHENFDAPDQEVKDNDQGSVFDDEIFFKDEPDSSWSEDSQCSYAVSGGGRVPTSKEMPQEAISGGPIDLDVSDTRLGTDLQNVLVNTECSDSEGENIPPQILEKDKNEGPEEGSFKFSIQPAGSCIYKAKAEIIEEPSLRYDEPSHQFTPDFALSEVNFPKYERCMPWNDLQDYGATWRSKYGSSDQEDSTESSHFFYNRIIWKEHEMATENSIQTIPKEECVVGRKFTAPSHVFHNSGVWKTQKSTLDDEDARSTDDIESLKEFECWAFDPWPLSEGSHCDLSKLEASREYIFALSNGKRSSTSTSAENKTTIAYPEVVVDPPMPNKVGDKTGKMADTRPHNHDFMLEFLKTTGWRPSPSRHYVQSKSTDTDSIGFTRRVCRESEGDASTVFSEKSGGDHTTTLDGRPVWYRFLHDNSEASETDWSSY